MRRAIIACFLVFACAPRASIKPPEATPLPPAQAQSPAPAKPAETPVSKPAEAVASAGSAAEPRFEVKEESEVVMISREGQPCPWLEYARAWNSLRFRSDRAECSKVSLGNAAAQASELLDALQKQLGPAFAPVSFGMNDYPEMYERIARAAKSSPDWDVALGKPKKGSLNAAVVALAGDAQAFYPEAIALFASRKLRPRFSSVEKVFVGPVSATPFADSLLAAGLKPNDKVPYGSIVWFHLDTP
jgi:hypothetical protein